MARVVAFTDDLLFGSRIVASLQAEGHEVVLAGDPAALAGALAGAGALIVDLTVDGEQRLAQVSAQGPPGVPALAFYSHVESDMRRRAQAAGLALVVPRSRMAREGPALVARLLSAAPSGSVE